MNDRALALSILREARDILAQRLTQRILDARDELLDDAHGLTYSGEIDNIYEQLAVRLNHLNVMLSVLPATDDGAANRGLVHGGAESPADSFELGARPEPSFFQADTVQPSGLAETVASAYEATALPPPTTFELFVRQIAAHEIEAASRSLAVLFAVDVAVARRLAATFYARYLESPDLVAKALQLRRELQLGSISGSLVLLAECFGLQGAEAVGVMQTLKARLIGHNEAG